MTVTTRYVNLNSTAGGDGTTNATTGATRAYASFAEFNTEEVGAVASGDILECICTGGSGLTDASEETLGVFTGDGLLVIKAASGQEATSPYDATRYIKDGPGGNDPAFRVTSNSHTCDTKLERLQVVITTTGSACQFGPVNFNLTLDSLFLNLPDENYKSGQSGGTPITMRNCIVIGTSKSNQNVTRNAGPGVVENCTSYDCLNVHRTPDSATVFTNNLARGGVTGWETGDSASDQNSADVSGVAPNATEDNTASPWNSSATADSAIFEDQAGGDYHLVGSSIFSGVGADLSGSFTHDFDGASTDRSAGDFTLGAFADPSSGAQSITPTGLGSGEAIGSGAVSPGAVGVAPTALTSTESHGTSAVSALYAIVASAIASGEAFGAGVVAPGSVGVTPGGIATSEAFGAAVLDSVISLLPSSIASGEAFGGASVSVGVVTIAPAGIGTGEALGAAVIAPGAVSVAPGGVAAGEAVGAHTIALGGLTLLPSAIASGEAFGTGGVAPGSVGVAPGGIATGEALGAHSVAIGAITLSPAGVASGESSGAHTLATGAVSISAAGVASSEAFGAGAVAPGSVILLPDGVATGELVGDAVVLTGATVIQPAGVASVEDFGAVTIVGGDNIVGWLVAQLGSYPVLAGALATDPGLAGALATDPGLAADVRLNDA